MDFKNTENCYERGVKLAILSLILNIPLYNLAVFVAVCNHDFSKAGLNVHKEQILLNLKILL